MKKYMSVLRMKFLNGIRNTASRRALAGMATQFAWGGLLVLLYKGVLSVKPGAVHNDNAGNVIPTYGCSRRF